MIATRVVSSQTDMERATYRWDFETEILAAMLPVHGASGPSRTVELSGAKGAFVALDLVGSTVVGLTVVVWPTVERVEQLQLPDPATRSRLELVGVGGGDADEVVELDVPLACEGDTTLTTIHLLVGKRRQVEVAALGRNLYVERDMKGQLAGFWLADVPPFPDGDARK